MIDFEKIREQVIAKLEKELPPFLKYHAPEHTKHVLEKTIHIAGKEIVNEHDLLLLKIAALYHDTGFIVQRENHEEISCQIATKELKAMEFEPQDIEKICGMILATKIPQRPKNRLEEILADADLEYLGTDKFDYFSSNLYEEVKHFQPDLNIDEWNEIQVNFISSHHYHTSYCRQFREPGKLLNLEKLRKSNQF